MTASIDPTALPPIPDGIHTWDGDCAINSVFARWRHPDQWKSPDQPTLHIYQGVIGELINDDQLAVDLAAEYLNDLGWTTVHRDNDKDWAWYHLTAPPGALPDRPEQSG